MKKKTELIKRRNKVIIVIDTKKMQVNENLYFGSSKGIARSHCFKCKTKQELATTYWNELSRNQAMGYSSQSVEDTKIIPFIPALEIEA